MPVPIPREHLQSFAAQAARAAGVRPELFLSLIDKESKWNPRARSPKGALGLAQLMPGTAKDLGVTDPYDVIQNLNGGARYLKQQLDTFGGDEALALAAYNAGPNAVEKHGGIPPYPETQDYVRKVLGGAPADTRLAGNPGNLGMPVPAVAPASLPPNAPTLPPQFAGPLQLPPQAGPATPSLGQSMLENPWLMMGLGILGTPTGTGSPITGIATGMATGLQAAAEQRNKWQQLNAPPDPTDLEQNLRFLVSTGMDPQQAMQLLAQRGAMTVNIGNGDQQFGPVPAGYVRTRQPDGSIVDAPLPGSKDAVELNQKVALMQFAQDNTQRLRALVGRYGSEGFPGFSDPKVQGEMAQLREMIIAAIAQLQNKGVLQEGERLAITESLPDPTTLTGALLPGQMEKLASSLDTLHGFFGTQSSILQGTYQGGQAPFYTPPSAPQGQAPGAPLGGAAPPPAGPPPDIGDALYGGARMGLNSLANGVIELGQRAGLAPNATPYQNDPAWVQASQAHPVAAAIGQGVPYLAGSGLAALATGGQSIPVQIGGQVLAGGLVGGLQPGTGLERLQRGGIDATLGGVGGAVGHGVGAVLANRGAAVAATGSDFTDAVIERARSLGFRTKPSTLRGDSPRLRNSREGKYETTLGSDRVMAELTDHNQEVLNRIAAQAIGAPANTAALTSDVLEATRTRLGKTFDDLMTSSRAVPVTKAESDALAAVLDANVRPFVAKGDPAARIVKTITTHLSTGQTNAAWVWKTQSDLRALARQQLTSASGDPKVGHELLDVADKLLDLGAKGLSATDRELLATARGQYKTLTALETGSNLDPISGMVSAPRLASYLQRRDPRGFMEGEDPSDLYTAVGFMGRLQQPLQSSGTAERLMPSLTQIGLSGVANVGAKTYLNGGPAWLRGGLQAGTRGATTLGQGGQDVANPPPTPSAPPAPPPPRVGKEAPPTARDYADRLPREALAQLYARPWFSGWFNDEVLPSRSSGRAHALRLAALSATDKTLTRDQKESILSIQRALDPKGDYRLKR